MQVLASEPQFDVGLRWRSQRKMSNNSAGPDYCTFYGHLEQLDQVIIPMNYEEEHWVGPAQYEYSMTVMLHASQVRIK